MQTNQSQTWARVGLPHERLRAWRAGETRGAAARAQAGRTELAIGRGPRRRPGRHSLSAGPAEPPVCRRPETSQRTPVPRCDGITSPSRSLRFQFGMD